MSTLALLTKVSSKPHFASLLLMADANCGLGAMIVTESISADVASFENEREQGICM